MCVYVPKYTDSEVAERLTGMFKCLNIQVTMVTAIAVLYIRTRSVFTKISVFQVAHKIFLIILYG